MWHRASATIAGRVPARSRQRTSSLVNLRRLATAPATVHVEDAAAPFHDHHDGRLDQRNGGLAVMPRGVNQGFDRGRRQ
jgi:hypothetical protein